jgi:hypothetical protein
VLNMADEANTQEAQASTAETTAAESQTVEQTTTPAEGEQTATEAAASTGDKSTSENKDAKQEFKPVSRRSAQFRIQQLNNRVKELEATQKPKEQEEGDEDAGDDQPQDKPDISALVAQEVERRLNPVISEHTKSADDAELNELFAGDKASERSKYEEPIRNAWKLDQYKNLAAADLYKIATYDEAVANAKAQAIEEYKKADKEAKESSASGSSNTSNRTDKGGKSVWDMSPEEFQKHNEQIKAKL